MPRLIIHINDPKQEKVVEHLLDGVKGIEVERDPAKPKKKVRAIAKSKRPITAAEKRFMKDMTEAFRSVRDHISGKKKLKTLKEVLDEL